MSSIKLVSAVLIVAVMSGCASSVKREGSMSPHAAAVTKFSSANVTMTPEAQKKLADNIKFSQTELAATVMRTLEANQQVDKAATASLDISITDFRVRGTFSAVMFGVLAGTDSLEGTATAKDSAGNVLRKFSVSASYGLGGWGGGQDSARLNWLYEDFAKKVSEELSNSKQ